MGYEIAGGLGVKLAAAERDVVVMLGDGSYLMANSEIATAVAMGVNLTIVLWTIAVWLHQQAAASLRRSTVQ